MTPIGGPLFNHRAKAADVANCIRRKHRCAGPQSSGRRRDYAKPIHEDATIISIGSDLGTAPVTDAAETPRERALRWRRIAARYGPPALRRRNVQLLASAVPFVALWDIGRASGRERVCP